MMAVLNVQVIFQVLVISAVAVGVLGRLELPQWNQITDQDDYDVFKFTADRPPGFVNVSFTGVVKSTGTNYTAYVARLSTGLPDTFGFQLPIGGCIQCRRNHTSATAKLHNCTYATNAGFFNMNTGCCVGNLVVDGKAVQLPSTNRVNFALTKDSFVIGYLTNETLHDGKFNFLQLISGAGWLVRRGEMYVNESMQKEDLPEVFVTEKAPRTTVAMDLNGTLYLVEVDGEEDTGKGLSLYEMAEVLMDLGCWQAVNLDGGGSSVSVYKGKVIDKPTCLDIPIICERSVTSITCIRNV